MTEPTALQGLVDRWRAEAAVFRTYGEDRLALACERHAGEVEDALQAARVEAVTLEEAADIGGYSYSHLQHLVAEGQLENMGEKGSPRIRRCDVPRKPRGGKRPSSKRELVRRSLKVHRGGA